MYQKEMTYFSNLAAERTALRRRHPLGIMIGGLQAGAYVGMGIILILTLGTDAPGEFQKLIMGATFAVALVLVIFAGAELFTGYTMYMTFGVMARRVKVSDAVLTSVIVWMSNFAGAGLLGLIYWLGSGDLLSSDSSLLQFIVNKKASGGAVELFFKGILCNWLVCLAIWISVRAKSDFGKFIGIFWCLFAFISSGFEHSVANMTVFTLATFDPVHTSVSLLDMGHNLLWVTLGNTFSGVVFMGLAYWYYARHAKL